MRPPNGSGIKDADCCDFRSIRLGLRLTEELYVFLPIHLPPLCDRAIGGLSPIQSEIISTCTFAQPLNKNFQILFTELLHTSFSQQVIGLSIA